MRTITINVYTIDEHPNREKCYEWIRNNWHDLNQHGVDEVAASIKALSEKIGGRFDCSISQWPDRNEYIVFKDYDHETLCRLSSEDCPLTGVVWDIHLITGLRNGKPNIVLDALHENTEWIYSDEGLYELCMANEYEFNDNGEFIS